MRGPGGLALSSRNAYLNKQELELAPEMNRLLHIAANDIRNGVETGLATQKAGKALSTAGFKLDYLEARHANTLAKLKAPSDPIRLLAAGWLGKTRLLDNIPV